MSFASRVKKELQEQIGKSKHCQLAELAAYFSVCGSVVMKEDGSLELDFQTENLTVIEKSYILFRKALRTVPDMSVRGEHLHTLMIRDEEDALRFMNAIDIEGGDLLVADSVIERQCCKRGFLRGIFVANGSINDPNNGYHLEIVAGPQEFALRIQQIIQSFQVEAKIVERKDTYFVYMKDGAAIVDFLNIIGAHKALMEYENVRILKEMRNTINRKVNCETANIKKTVSAGTRQVEDIQFIHDTIGFGSLSDSLAQIARVRLDNPDISLKELGELLDPPIGKSGVNHRLRRLSQIAKTQREKTQNGGKI
ncbi:MAG: DNA-binding protein WhiA [Eubacterium sp.]|nr:DNA-binding protein WhiA [Eubacterium sp.]